MAGYLRFWRAWFDAAFVAALSLVVVLSNRNDWDHFFSFLEADLRSWLIDHEPPLWSYQLCAGATRAGDPQAFGLSPLFLPVALFGSFWGAKALLVLCALGGYWFYAGILDLAGGDDSREARENNRLLSAAFSFGNFFLWHYYAGHLTFALYSFAMVPLYFLWAQLSRRLASWELACLSGSLLLYCTAGFYHSFIFLLLPLAGSGLLFFSTGGRLFSLRWNRRQALATLCAVAAAIALSSYKWLAVLRYQLEYPRVLTPMPEAASPAMQLARFFLPTIGFDYLGVFSDPGPWMVYEHSAFSLLPWIALALLGWCAARGEGAAWWRAHGWRFAALLALFLLFLLGDALPFSLFTAVNRALFHGSVRVVGRFSGAWLFVLGVGLAHFLGRNRAAARWLHGASPLLLPLILLNMLLFLVVHDYPALQAAQSAPFSAEGRMRALAAARMRTVSLPGDSYMYPLVLAGMIVPNCYQPLAREMRIGHERWRSEVLPAPTAGQIPLWAEGAEPLSPRCKDSIHATQNHLFFDGEACPHDLCFHLNMRNPADGGKLAWNPARKLFCRSY